MVKLISCIIVSTLFAIPVSNAKDFNFGIQAFNSPPAYSSYFQQYSDFEVQNYFNTKDREILAAYLVKIGKPETNAKYYSLGRTLKMTAFDSVYVTAYYSDSYPPKIHILNDLCSGKQIVLDDLSEADFNQLLSTYNDREKLDAVSLAKLYVVLSNPEEQLYFLDGVYDIQSAYNVLQLGYGYLIFSENSYKKFQKKYEGKLNESLVVNGETTLVSIFVYDMVKKEATRVNCEFINGSIVKTNYETVIGRPEIDKLFAN